MRSNWGREAARRLFPPGGTCRGQRALITRPGRELCLATLSPDSGTRMRPGRHYISQGLSRRGTPTSGESLGSRNESQRGLGRGPLAVWGPRRRHYGGEATVRGMCREYVSAGSRRVGVCRGTGRAGQGACSCLEFLCAVRVPAACERRCVLE